LGTIMGTTGAGTQSRRGSIYLGIGVAIAAVVGLAFLTVAGTRRLLRVEYPQDTPEAVLASAKKMVQNGDADRLPDLIYAPTPQMRDLLNELGTVLGSLQDLAREVQRSYPEEVAALRAEAEASALKGGASGFIQKVIGQAGPLGDGRGRRGGRSPAGAAEIEDRRRLFDNAMKEVFADPYGWLAQSEGRLTVRTWTEDDGALLWDGKPVFGIGLPLHREGGKWYLMLPTNAPGVSRMMPRSKETWQIMGDLMSVFDNMIRDLTRDVRAGRAPRLEDLGHRAGEKAFVPAVLVFFSYGRALEAEKKEAKAAAQRQAAPAVARR
jgi:hypothetical protein